jgi:hypothetical protein
VKGWFSGITQPFGSGWAIALETLLLPLLAVALGIWINPIDPLWSDSGFPWAWFAPVILALRYGPFPGLGGAGVLLLAWIAFSGSGWIGGEFPKINFLGGLILIMICGEFSSLWVARTRRAESVQLYLDQRLEHLTHQYYLLRLSHDRLEQDLISRPMAMREALSTLRQPPVAGDDGGPLKGGAALLRLLAQYCQLETASLHPVDGDDLVGTATATLGGGAPLTKDDPLLLKALRENRLCHVQQTLAAGDNPSRYLIVAPLIQHDGRRRALLIVERLPFFALHDETLQTLNLLLGYYTDGLLIDEVAAPVRAALPDCPPEFAFEMRRLARIYREAQVGSVLVALEVPATPGFEDLARQIGRQRRSLDVTWQIDTPDRHVLITLMPLAGEAAAEGYLARIEQWVLRQREQSLDAAGIIHTVTPLSDEPAVPLLTRLLETCHVADQTRPLRTSP